MNDVDEKLKQELWEFYCSDCKNTEECACDSCRMDNINEKPTCYHDFQDMLDYYYLCDEDKI